MTATNSSAAHEQEDSILCETSNDCAAAANDVVSDAVSDVTGDAEVNLAASCNKWWLVNIEMPIRPIINDNEIEAQLFSYVANAPAKSGITTIADLDDDWVKANFDDLQSLADLRAVIAERLKTDIEYEYADIKYKRCADALIKASGVTVSDAQIDADVEKVAKRIETSIRGMGISKAVYLENEGIDEETFVKRVREETKHTIAINKALDAAASAMQLIVSKDELPTLLSSENPEQFVEELEKKGEVEQACQAALRVKAMREIIAEAKVVSQV